MTDEAKKIIIDEDWKTQVEAEREAVRKEPPAAGANTETEPGAASADAASEADVPLPPADLLFLASTLYMQAVVALGLIANPMTGETKVQPAQAKHAIDTLQMLEEKTQGNRTEEETEGIEAMLHELRMTFVTVQSNPRAK